MSRRATGAIVPERQRCRCLPDLCMDQCRACNYSGRDLEEMCIADPDWEPDDDDLARREGLTRVQAIEAAEDHADQVAFDAWRERGQ